MSAESVNAVVRRSMSDEEFLNRLASDPGEAVSSYNLTADELAALQSRDEDRILEAAGRKQAPRYIIVPGVDN